MTHKAIVDALANAGASNEPVVLATVVQITGSSYGGVGTRMIVKADGTTVGLVSGGCLEADLAEHARKVHVSGKAAVVTYDTRADDDAAWGLGLGCNGLIDILLEPLAPAAAGALAVLLQHALDADARSVLASVIQSPEDIGMPVPGAHALFIGSEMETAGNWGDGSLLHLMANDAMDAFNAGRRGMVREYRDVQVAFEVITPSIRLVICGSGPDVVPLVRFGAELGWNIIVVDHRPVEHAHPERFPGARVAECAEASALAQCVALSSHTAAVVMSHHYARDVDYVRALLASDISYIGVLGPRARAERMLADMAARGDALAGTDRMFAPVGLDLGGEGPDAIALSIIAEVSAVMTKGNAAHLRDRKGPLHAAPSEAEAAS
jgi:xanthine dehydrogenase accessory factor